MKCGSCGKTNPSDAAFCTACGKMLSASDGSEAPKASDTVKGMKTLEGGLPGSARRRESPKEPRSAPYQPPSIQAPDASDRSYVTDMSISLATMGVRSPARTGLMVLGVMLAIVAFGAGGMYLIMWLTMPQPAAVASVPEPEEGPVDLGLMVMGFDHNDGGVEDAPDAADEDDGPDEPAVAKAPARPRTVRRRPPNRQASSTKVESPPQPPPSSSKVVDDDEVMDMDTYSSRVRGLVTVFYAAHAQRCFPDSARGTVVVRFTIQPDGQVTNPRVVQDSTGDPSVGQCLVRQISSWHLTPPPNGQPTAFALTFAQ